MYNTNITKSILVISSLSVALSDKASTVTPIPYRRIPKKVREEVYFAPKQVLGKMTNVYCPLKSEKRKEAFNRIREAKKEIARIYTERLNSTTPDDIEPLFHRIEEDTKKRIKNAIQEEINTNRNIGAISVATVTKKKGIVIIDNFEIV